MYVSARTVMASHLLLRDGRKRIRDLLVDDRSWNIVHLVVDSGDWLPDKDVLISPEDVDPPQQENDDFRTELTRQDISSADEITADAPVCRQKTYSMASYYGPRPSGSASWNPNLRSVEELLTYRITTQGDDEVGPVADAAVWCQGQWMLRYFISDLGSLLSKHLVPLPAVVVRRVKWEDRQVEVYLNQQTLAVLPQLNSIEQLARCEFESELHRILHGRPGQWWPEAEAT